MGNCLAPIGLSACRMDHESSEQPQDRLMRPQTPITCSILCALCTGIGLAQAEAQVEMSQGRATAGDRITLSITLDAPTACNATVYVDFNPSKQGRAFELNGPAPNGQTRISFTGQIPFDQPGE